jgi:hypothetical protein
MRGPYNVKSTAGVTSYEEGGSWCESAPNIHYTHPIHPNLIADFYFPLLNSVSKKIS